MKIEPQRDPKELSSKLKVNFEKVRLDFKSNGFYNDKLYDFKNLHSLGKYIYS